MKISRKINGMLRSALNVELRRIHKLPFDKSSHDRSDKKIRHLSALYISTLQNAFYESTSLPGFIEEDPTPLIIQLGKDELSIVRIELKDTGIINIHSIAFLDNCGSIIDINVDKISVSASSLYGNSTDNIIKSKLFNITGNHTVGIHTRQEKSPWIELKFLQPIDVSAVVINNRKDIWAARAVDMNVEVSDRSNRLIAFHEVSRTSEFKTKSNEIADRFGMNYSQELKYIHNFISLLVSRKYQLAVTAYGKIPLKSQSKIRELVNSAILNNLDLEWTSHGVRRSFRFWSEENKLEFISFSNEVIKDIRKVSPDICLGFGSVLGAVRDQDLIAHDDDMDTIVAFKPSQVSTIKEGLRIIKNHLEPKGYAVVDNFPTHCHVSKRGYKVDVFVGLYDESNAIGWYPSARGSLYRKDIFPAKKTKLLGIDVYIPKNANKYLEATYSKDWTSPQPNWKHSWNIAEYKDILGI